MPKPPHRGHQGLAVGHIAFVHRDGHRAATCIGEQTVVDLQRATASIAAVTELGQRTGRALEVAGGQVIEHQAALAQVASCKLLLDARLALKQPIHRRVQFVLRGIGHVEVLGQRRGVPPAGGGQLRVRRHDARGHHRQHQVAFGAVPGGDQGLEAQLAHGYTHALNMAVGARGDCLKVLGDRAQLFAAQHGPNCQDLLVGERGEVRKGALVHARTLAIGLTQQIGGASATVRNDIDMHGYIIHNTKPKRNTLTWLHIADTVWH